MDKDDKVEPREQGDGKGETESEGGDNQTKTVSKTEYVRMILAEKMRIVLTQTGYDEKTALSILQSNGWDCSDAIKRYMKEEESAHKQSGQVANDDVSNPSPISKPKSVNQKIYTEIRKLMDESSMSYYREKERKEEMQRYVERLREEKEKEEQRPNEGESAGAGSEEKEGFFTEL